MRDFAVRAVRHCRNMLNIKETSGRQADDKRHLADSKGGLADGAEADGKSGGGRQADGKIDVAVRQKVRVFAAFRGGGRQGRQNRLFF